MPIISSLEVQKKNKERVNLFVDDEFFCGMTMEDCIKQKLTVGMEITDADLVNIQNNSHQNDIYNKTLIYILKSPKTKKSVRDYLFRKQCEPAEAEAIISRLERSGYINDTDYAQRFAESKSQETGARCIRMKLLQKGVERDLIDEAVSTIGDQTDLAQTLATKYMRNREFDQRGRASLYRYLLSKGFDYETVGNIVNNYKGEK